MMASLKAEFRKVFTVRSTLFIFLICLVLIGLFAFYGQGLSHSQPVTDPRYLEQAVKDAVNALGFFIALIGVLLMTHEYRYNTIMHTLTASNSRSKTLIAKIITVSVVSIAFAFIFGTLSPLATKLGLSIKGTEIVPQVFYFKDLIWHVAFYAWGFAMAGLLLAVLIRNQIGAVVSLLLFPSIVEQLLSFVLKDNAIYLPFIALGSVINHNDKMTDTRGASVFIIYLVVGWIVGWILFLRRDAN